MVTNGEQHQHPDYVVIGGGTAGCIIAARLAEDTAARVLLLEAGPRDRHPLIHWPAGFAKMTKGLASWGWETVPQTQVDQRRIWFTQARVLGGGSSINAQIYTRGHPADYDEWAALTENSGWSFAGVLPYFKRAERNARLGAPWHGTDGPVGVSDPLGALPICDAFIAACQEFGLPHNPDFNGAHQEGAGYYQLTQWGARRCSTAVGYLSGHAHLSNLTVVTGSQVLRVLVEKARVVGVEIAKGGQVQRISANREVILCAGTIGSPRILQLSGIGPADDLGRLGIPVVLDAPEVGGNLQDHINICALAECTGPHSYDTIQRPDRLIGAGLRYLLTRTGPVTSSLFETGGFASSAPSESRPDIQFHLGLGSGIEKGIAKLDNAGVTLNSAFLRPASRGTVRLAAKDPAAAPLIDPRYWSEQSDLQKSLRGLEMAREILRQPALSDWIKREALPGDDVMSRPDLVAYAHRMAKTDHHPVGTCRMGADADSVVDPDLKMRGLDGLRIADASVMPTLPSCNTNAPTIMIAEKASDLIRGKTPLAAAGAPASEP